MFGTILVIVVIAGGIAALVLSQSKQDGKKSWIQFFAKGKDAGFSIGEIEMLRRLAVKCSLGDPTSLFWSQAQLDRCIKNMVHSARRAAGGPAGGDQNTQNFLSKLYDYRKKIEMERPKIRNGIPNTREIEEGQGLRLLVEGQRIFDSWVIKNTGQYLTIARPNSSRLPFGFSWTGVDISVYFWREDDAGYVFDTIVKDEILSKGKPTLMIGHGKTLFRTQKRRSIRIKTHKVAFLYIMADSAPSNSIEMNPGIKCFVENLSDTGCGVLVGGRAAKELRLKVQFVLNNAPVCISGTARSVEYNEEQNKSLLHVEADPMNIETRNLIMGEVFGMLPEEEELPFRIPNEETSTEIQDGEKEENNTTEAVADASATADFAI